ncbi:hypothetical protein Nazgul73 [Burkholderia phage BcepNazgul]|uniref:Uncharacterized protein n=1 Tax=Burkholderia phage BcepNazgul TaxID=242861 RepID=Q6UYG7_9CAUD|nr:hypothetical protein Nazgul73 [Burkholderia phage BcepNazgul]AAQ63374.1 hypothetical protein Nazgul73 [Burkholderia phage BcepNazgul]
MVIPMPAWFDALSPEEQETERTKLVLKLAAIYASREQTVQRLSELVGYSSNTLGALSSTGRALRPELCIEIEKAVGHEYLPRRLLNPHIFEVPTAGE